MRVGRRATWHDGCHPRFLIISCFITASLIGLAGKANAFVLRLPTLGPFVANSKWSSWQSAVDASSVTDIAEGNERHQQTSSSSVDGNPFIRGPARETKPDYDSIVGPLGKHVDNLFMVVFRGQLAKHAGIDSDRSYTDYQGIIEVASALNQNFQDREDVQKRAQATLQSVFPSWLPAAYAELFSKPHPAVRRCV